MDSSETSYAQKFERLLQRFPHPERRSADDPDRRRWKMVEISRQTGGKISSSYLSGLRNGQFQEPGMRHLDLIAQTMDFPFELWLTEPEQWDRLLRERKVSGSTATSHGPQQGHPATIAALLEQLISSITNRHTGEPFTESEIADYSGGRLSEEDVKAMRSGEMERPYHFQVLALCDVFGVDPAYWSGEPTMPVVSQEDLEALREARNSNTSLLVRKSLGLSEEQVNILLLMADQLRSSSEDRPGNM